MSSQKVKVRAPAKINLYLRVLNKRADGYHNIQSILQPISLYDELEFELVSQGVEVNCNQADISPADNLVRRAAMLLQQRFAPSRGVRIYLDKQIPIAAGLGGGSSDAAVTLCTLNTLWELNLSRERLLQLAAELGADVPFFIDKKAALAEGIGERLSPWLSLSCWVLLVKPDFSVSTAWAYQNLGEEGLTKKGNCIKILQPIWARHDLTAVGAALFNDFEPLVVGRYPLIGAIKKGFLAAGALGALMSGSGPAVFGLFAQEAAAGAALSVLKRFVQGKGVVFLVKAIG